MLYLSVNTDLFTRNIQLDTRFVEIMDEQLDTIPYEISNMFIDGFRLGARMMIEVFEDKQTGEV